MWKALSLVEVLLEGSVVAGLLEAVWMQLQMGRGQCENGSTHPQDTEATNTA